MRIFLAWMHLLNFKSIRDRKTSFDDPVTSLLGHNETGKTTHLDSFLWCLFGKDSTGRADFEIKTINRETGEPYHRLEHSVECCLIIDGMENRARRVYTENWVTQRGQREEVMKGHTTAFYWNDVPMKESEYKAKVASIVDENLFRLLTNVTYFNSLKWQDRRSVLMAIAGKITDDDVAKGIPEFEALLDSIRGKKTLEGYKKEIDASRKKVREELDTLPTRIQEAQRAVPEAVDYEAVQTEIDTVTSDLSHIESLLSSKTAAAKQHEELVLAAMNKRSALSRELQELASGIRRQFNDKKIERDNKIYDADRQIKSVDEDLNRARREHQDLTNRKTAVLDEMGTLRSKWNTENEKTISFAPGQFCCPTCNREYEATDVEAKKRELTANFNRNKSEQLQSISDRGKRLAEEQADIEVRLGNLTARGNDLKSQLETLKQRKDELVTENARLLQQEAADLDSALSSNPRVIEIRSEVERLTETIEQPHAEDNSDLLHRKAVLQGQVVNLKLKFASKDLRDKQLARVAELTGQEETLSQKHADLEGIEYTILQFEKAKMSLVEERVNSKFKIARFRMFDQQINGGEVPTCITLVGNVPYPDANNAGKIQAGLDIINVLSDHYGIQAPVWIDNRESVINLPETPLQVINLFVSEAHTQLTKVASQQRTAAVA